MRHRFVWLLTLSFLAPLARAHAADALVLVDGRPVGRGIIIAGTVYLPCRSVAEALGASVSYDSANRVVSLYTRPAVAPTAQVPIQPLAAPTPPVTTPPPPRVFNSDLDKRAVAFVRGVFPEKQQPSRPELFLPPQPALPPPVRIPSKPGEIPPPASLGQAVASGIAHGLAERAYEDAVHQEAKRREKVAMLLLQFQQQSDSATAEHQQALEQYEKDLRDYQTYSAARSRALATANAVLAAAGTPEEPQAWRDLSAALVECSGLTGLSSEASAVSTELARLARQEASLPPSSGPKQEGSIAPNASPSPGPPEPGADGAGSLRASPAHPS